MAKYEHARALLNEAAEMFIRRATEIREKEPEESWKRFQQAEELLRAVDVLQKAEGK